MNIVHFAETLPIGGLANYVLTLAQGQQEQGHRVTIAHMDDKPGSYLETEGVTIIPVKNAADLAALKPDVVHTHLLSDPAMLADLPSLGVPLLRSFHDYTSTCLRRGKRRWPGDRCQRALNMGCAAYGCLIGPPKAGSKVPSLMNLCAKIDERNRYRSFDAAIVGSRHMQNMLLKNGFDPARVHMIPYFSRFAALASQAVIKPSGAGKDRPLEMLFTGQAVKGKGLEVLIAALGGVRGQWKLTVHCEGPRLEAAKALAQELGIAQHITFNGWVGRDALEAAYKRADLFILPSIWDDPGPLVGIEALACATPVAGFAVGGIPDYVRDGQTGFLVTDVSAKGLQAALQQALDTPEALAKMGSNGQALVLENHTAQGHFARMDAIYQNLTAQKKDDRRAA